MADEINPVTESAGSKPALPLRRVLVALDFSAPARAALGFVVALLSKFEAELHLVHVFALDYPLSSVSAPPLAVAGEEIQRRVRAQLHDAALRYGVTIRREDLHAVRGTPFREICRLAEELAIDLVVTGTRGQTGLRHLLLGSTAERIVRHAPCPVLIVRSLGENSQGRTTVAKILVPTDFSACAEVGLNAAKALAKTFGSELVLLYSVDLHSYSTNPEFMLYDLPPLLEAAQNAGLEQLDGLVNAIGQEDLSVAGTLADGHPGDQICREAEKLGTDLIVTSTHGRTGLPHVLLGSTAEYVVRHAPCPVLVIPARKRNPRPAAD
jgi:nucleotide-binding universal stress UspA family protein